jgi:hypothetical protein
MLFLFKQKQFLRRYPQISKCSYLLLMSAVVVVVVVVAFQKNLAN